MLDMVDELLERFVAWAEWRDDVRGAVMMGSRARSDHPADDFSDMDIIVLATDPRALLDDAGHILFDKDGLLAELAAGNRPPETGPPSAREFHNGVSDFWYHAVWAARKLRRGELFTAKTCCDSYMKRLPSAGARVARRRSRYHPAGEERFAREQVAQALPPDQCPVPGRGSCGSGRLGTTSSR